MLPIISCPLVAADKEVSTPALSTYIKAFSVRPVSPTPVKTGEALVFNSWSNFAMALQMPFRSLGLGFEVNFLPIKNNVLKDYTYRPAA